MPKAPELAPNVISRIRELIDEQLKNELDKAGLSGLVSSHGHILGCLYQEEPLPMNRIAEKINRRKSTLTVLADRLEQEGYIRRVTPPDDSRVRQLALTDKGRASRRAFTAISDDLQNTLWAGFSQEEKAFAMDFFARMEANLLRGAPAKEPE